MTIWNLETRDHNGVVRDSEAIRDVDVALHSSNIFYDLLDHLIDAADHLCCYSPHDSDDEWDSRISDMEDSRPEEGIDIYGEIKYDLPQGCYVRTYVYQHTFYVTGGNGLSYQYEARNIDQARAMHQNNVGNAIVRITCERGRDS